MKRLIGGTGLLVGLVVLAIAATALATPVIGVKSTVFAIGAFDELHAKTLTPHWQARIDTKGATDVHVIENVLPPGASFGSAFDPAEHRRRQERHADALPRR